MAFIYPGGDEQETVNLGLATWGMDEVLANNMIILDAAVGGGGTVTSFSAGNIDAIATTSVATPTTTPALTFALTTQAANTVWAGPASGVAATPTFRALVSADLPAGTGTVTSVTGTANQIVATGSTAVVLSIANPFTFPGPASMGSNYISETRVVSAGGTTTAGLLVKTQPTGNVQTAALGDVGTIGIAVTSQTAGQNVEVARIGLISAVADNTITIGDVLGVGTVTAGRVSDLGQTSSLGVSNQLQIVGKAITAAVAGGTFTMQVYGPGFYGELIPSGQVLWSSLGNAAANLTLANAAFTTTFNQTSAVPWLWANTTIASAITTNASPLLELAANYWTGAASAQDLWSISSALAAGTNGASNLTIAHTGSTSNAGVVVPAGAIGTPGLYVGTVSNDAGIWTSASQINIQGPVSAAGVIGLFGQGTQNAKLALNGSNFSLITTIVNDGAGLVGDVTTSAVPAVMLQNAGSFTGTTGLQSVVAVVGTWAPTSGTGTFSGITKTLTINNTGSSGSYTGMSISAVETALNGTTANKLVTLKAGVAGTAIKFEINNSGIVDVYNGVTLTGSGIATEVGIVTAGLASAAIGAANLLAAPSAATLYRVSAYLKITVATTTPVAGPITLTYADKDGVAQSVVMSLHNAAGAVATTTGSTTTTPVNGDAYLYTNSGTAIQYAIGFSGTGTYEYILKCEVM